MLFGTERINVRDDNIASIRQKHPGGLHFVVGDTHGEEKTLKALMEKIAFDPSRDHVYFVGDYNAGGSPQALLSYMSLYYREDYDKPGFHLIRGNHERELSPMYYLENLPDIIVFRGKTLNYYIVHAGMVSTAFHAINEDMAKSPDQSVYAYSLDRYCTQYDAPLRQLIWSRKGLYSQRSQWQNWPRTGELIANHACIIHGHSPYCFFMQEYSGYGDMNLFWEDQHIWFSEDLCSFNIDSNIKGRYVNGESYRGLACVCLEVFDEIASKNRGRLSVETIRNTENGVFGVAYLPEWYPEAAGDINKILNAKPRMKTITLDGSGTPWISE